MPVQYKDIDDLSQRSTPTGSEKLPVSDTEYLTAQQVADLAPVPTQLSQLSGDTTHRTVTDAQIGTWDGKYDIPAGGIPAEDLDGEVQAALVDAETAYQKPADGIPATDLDEDVQASLDAADTAVQPGDLPTVPTVTLNGSVTTSPSFYAPTTAGTSGYVLTSSGSGAPTWQAAPSGGGDVTDVTLGGTSVVDQDGVAVLPAYPVVEALTTAEIDTIWNAAMA